MLQRKCISKKRHDAIVKICEVHNEKMILNFFPPKEDLEKVASIVQWNPKR